MVSLTGSTKVDSTQRELVDVTDHKALAAALQMTQDGSRAEPW